MGKIRTRILGMEDVEEKQKQEQKLKSQQKKAAFVKSTGGQKKIRAPGMKGGERMTQVEVGDESMEKLNKAKALIEKDVDKSKSSGKKKEKKTQVHPRGKKYQAARKMFDKEKEKSKIFPLDQAVKLLKKVHFAKFDESVELHLNVIETGLKGMVEFPHTTGKSVKIRIVDDAALKEIEAGKINFDILITHPSFMPKLARFAKVLGPKGLMPNPKAGTISPNPEEVAKKYAKGGVRWKTEAKAPLIHQLIGKISFDDTKLIENAKTLLANVGKPKIQRAFIKTTMSPSLRLDLEKI